MKRNLTFIILLVCSLASAQNISDVLRYSSENIQGTARYQGMGGAFGALGGDLSALNINPAGSAIFNNNLGTVSGTVYNRDNVITYGGNATATSPNYLDINQAGGVLVFKSTLPTSPWSKVALALNYDVTENFDDNIFASGTTNEGIDNYFLNFAQGVPFGDITLREGEFIEEAYLDIGANLGFGDQQAFLGYFGGLIDPAQMENDNTAYISNADYTTVNQEFSRITSGYNSKFTLNLASQYRERLSIGASVNFHSILYNRNDQFTETGYNADSEIQRTTFDNRLFTQGSGFSLNVGAIAKLSDFLRIGGSYQSPTWYRLEDELSQSISSDLADDNINFINFDQVNIFPTYKLRVPGKVMGSLALIFGKNGLLSFDYSFQDFSEAKLGPVDDVNFASVNSDVSRDLGTVNTFRLGGEYRIDRFSLRAGYRFDESPYESLNTVGDLESISGGIGYNFGGSRLDLAINRTERDVAQRLFDTGINSTALVNGVSMNGTLSYTVNF
ncbi:aromatic hydrocarbon degradation protein [Maribacter algarum]|uniref:Aromatic hydrocarbon degradation protein n=1 Tax=Maribacter algarum (ex Zhang et al. 2020) TaxID=2578118 RepID=A0A5S3PX08_9FLAO|nr:outer membrane protein transport protein [Maribacter algarum]TMM59535.1 aromatic hydrocarbon degradation protein [Maribacter algarum]